MVNALALVGNLKTALTHAEMHSVHVDEARVRLIVCSFIKIRVSVLENWNFNINF